MNLDGHADGALDGTVYLWNATTPDRTAPIAKLGAHRERVGALAFDPADYFLVSGGWDDSVRFIDLAVLDTPAAALLAAVEARWGSAWQSAVAGSRPLDH